MPFKDLKKRKEYYKIWRLKNAEAIKIKTQQYRFINKDRINVNARKYNQINKDIIKEKKRSLYILNRNVILNKAKIYYKLNKVNILKVRACYFKKHHDLVLQRQKQYNRSHKDEIVKKTKLWRINNPIKFKLQIDNYRLHIRENNKKYYLKHRTSRIKLSKLTHYGRLAKDSTYRMKSYLRSYVFHALRYYTLTGKIFSSRKYGIDYKAIIEQLKPFPENMKDYHIDHIKPLCSFNFINFDGSTNFDEIKKAFAPENHQWLLAKENLSKSSKWNGITYRRAKVQNGITNTN